MNTVMMTSSPTPSSLIGGLALEAIVSRALEEDLSAGDLTTLATVAADTPAVARAIAKTTLVVCGGPVFEAVFHKVDATLTVESSVSEGQRVSKGEVLWTVRGRAQTILMAERTALNFVQRLCGIATLTRRFVDALPKGSTTRITDTRKTTPGLRALERYAVRCGGGHNHRDNLGSAVLIKDNHIVAAGGVTAAVQAARAVAPHTSKIEVEVTTFVQLDEALAAGAEIVMLDNFDDSQVAQALARVSKRAEVEISGGMTLDRVAALGQLDVDIISVGALTHSAPAADISLELDLTS
jgi:nicotinate-nucleotide pyrophosphorylase (carboxylating)